MPENKDLSEREVEILKLVATGVSNKEIAYRLKISTNTVKVHLRNIFAKIGVASRTEAAMYAVSAGLVETSAKQAEDRFAQMQDDRSAAELETGVGRIWKLIRRSRLLIFITLCFLLIAGGIVGVVLARNARVTSNQSQDGSIAPLAPRWQELSPLPEARAGMAAVVYESRIYAIAGETIQGISGIVRIYDPQKDTWSIGNSKPTPVSDVQAALIREKIYVPGGKLASGLPTERMEIYDPRRDEWEAGVPLPAPRSAYALVAFEGRLYLFGGWDGQKAVDTVFEFDPENGAWRERTPLPSARMYAGAVETAGKILVVGGTDGNKALADVWAYYPGRDAGGDRTWEQRAALPAARYAMGITSIADTVYVVGGQGSANPVEYLSSADQWMAFETPASLPGWSLALAGMGNFIYAIGGEGEKGVTGLVESYQAMYTIDIPNIIR